MYPLDVDPSIAPWAFWRIYRQHRAISPPSGLGCAAQCFCCATVAANRLGLDPKPWADRAARYSDGLIRHSFHV